MEKKVNMRFGWIRASIFFVFSIMVTMLLVTKHVRSDIELSYKPCWARFEIMWPDIIPFEERRMIYLRFLSRDPSSVLPAHGAARFSDPVNYEYLAFIIDTNCEDVNVKHVSDDLLYLFVHAARDYHNILGPVGYDKPLQAGFKVYEKNAPPLWNMQIHHGVDQTCNYVLTYSSADLDLERLWGRAEYPEHLMGAIAAAPTFGMSRKVKGETIFRESGQSYWGCEVLRRRLDDFFLLIRMTGYLDFNPEKIQIEVGEGLPHLPAPPFEATYGIGGMFR